MVIPEIKREDYRLALERMEVLSSLHPHPHVVETSDQISRRDQDPVGAATVGKDVQSATIL